jgi:hypothetical protein
MTIYDWYSVHPSEYFLYASGSPNTFFWDISQGERRLELRIFDLGDNLENRI